MRLLCHSVRECNHAGLQCAIVLCAGSWPWLEISCELLQATNGLRQTEKAFEVLYSRLRDREVHNEITTCLTMIMDALADRHYQRANEVYLQLSIGNQQWPIGVTSIGIHDRTAREKLSYYSNTKSQAHIMNDEATRKYLHGISRLIAAVQRLHPADPSRSYNFNAVEVRTEQLQPPNNVGSQHPRFLISQSARSSRPHGACQD